MPRPKPPAVMTQRELQMIAQAIKKGNPQGVTRQEIEQCTGMMHRIKLMHVMYQLVMEGIAVIFTDETGVGFYVPKEAIYEG